MSRRQRIPSQPVPLSASSMRMRGHSGPAFDSGERLSGSGRPHGQVRYNAWVLTPFAVPPPGDRASRWIVNVKAVSTAPRRQRRHRRHEPVARYCAPGPVVGESALPKASSQVRMPGPIPPPALPARQAVLFVVSSARADSRMRRPSLIATQSPYRLSEKKEARQWRVSRSAT